MECQKPIGIKAFGQNRQEIGRIQNVIFDPAGKVLKLIGDTGGLLGFDDQPIAVNWNDAKLGPALVYVNTPIAVESVKKYGLFGHSVCRPLYP